MAAESSQEFGEELRRERELRDVTREQLANITKVSLRQISALETGRFEQLPALVFSRGFVRSIALHLGLDPDRTVAGFSHVYRGWEEKERSREQAAMLSSGSHPLLRVPARRSRVTRTTMALAATVAVLLGGTVVTSLLKSRPAGTTGAVRTPSDRPESGPASLALPPAIAAAAVPLPPERPAAAPASASEALASTLAPRAVTASAPRTMAEAPRVVTAAAAAAGLAGSRLTLTFRDDCWTEVIVDGKVVAAELFRKGATREFAGGRRFVLTLGNAGGVEVAVDGRSLQALGAPGEVVRDFPIEPKRS